MAKRKPVRVVLQIGMIAVTALAAWLVTKTILRSSTTVLTRPLIGEQVRIPGVDFSVHPLTLVMAIQQGCHFCAESLPFYERLIQKAAQNRDLQTVIVLPLKNNRDYVKQLGLRSDRVETLDFSSIHVGATPTLVLVNNQARVLRVWIGKLASTKEVEVLQAVGEDGNIAACDACQAAK